MCIDLSNLDKTHYTRFLSHYNRTFFKTFVHQLIFFKINAFNFFFTGITVWIVIRRGFLVCFKLSWLIWVQTLQRVISRWHYHLKIYKDCLKGFCLLIHKYKATKNMLTFLVKYFLYIYKVGGFPACADPESFARGCPTLTTFFLLWGERGSQ